MRKLYSFIEGYTACLKGRAITEGTYMYMYLQMCTIVYKHGIEKHTIHYCTVHSYESGSHLQAAIKQRQMSTALCYTNTTYMYPHSVGDSSCAHSYEPRDPCQPLSTHHMYQLGHIRRGRRVMPTNPDSVSSSQLENSALRPTTGHLSYTDLSSLLFSVDHLPPKLSGHTIMTKMEERSIICIFLVCA